MRKCHNTIVAAILAVSPISCNKSESGQCADAVTAVATELYNWRYSRCLPLVTPESTRQLQFLASNVTDADVELLRNAKEASVEVLDSRLDDTVFVATVAIRDFLMPDSIGSPARHCDYAETEIRLVRKGEKWLADLSHLPRFRVRQTQ